MEVFRLFGFRLGGFNRSFPFRVTYEKVLNQVEYADEEAKKTKRAPRSYEESDKKLKTVKIVTKKGDVTAEENKKKKPKQMAASAKQPVNAVQEEEEEERKQKIRMKMSQKKKKRNNNQKKKLSVEQEENERNPLEEVQQPVLSVAEKLQALGKRPAPFSKPSAK